MGNRTVLARHQSHVRARRVALRLRVVAGLCIAAMPAHAWAVGQTNTPTPTPAPQISVTPAGLSLGCARSSFDITITNAGAPGSTLQIRSLKLANGYSQGSYGTGFSWDLSHIVLPASLPAGGALTIPVTFSAAGQFDPSRLELRCDSNAANSPHLLLVYYGGGERVCGTETPTPTATATPTPTSNRPRPIARATVYPNPAYSGDIVTLDGMDSSQPFESAQWFDDQGAELAPGLVATFVAPNVTTETTLHFSLILRNFGGSSGDSTSVFVTVLPATCTGDCNEDHSVVVNEAVTMVNIALGEAELSACPLGDRSGDGQIAIDELVVAVQNVLTGCPNLG